MLSWMRRLKARRARVLGMNVPSPHRAYKRAAEGRIYRIVKER